MENIDQNQANQAPKPTDTPEKPERHNAPLTQKEQAVLNAKFLVANGERMVDESARNKLLDKLNPSTINPDMQVEGLKS
ncbi:MAG: hypothetical protein RI935_54 [Candidatus Parcubacteria bacterium]|jgi:uncharacterized membrane protein YebE (DUF533 family)